MEIFGDYFRGNAMGQIKKIAILTGGGDCPGLNAAIRAVTKTAILDHGCEVIGILDGFEGAVQERKIDLHYDNVANILSLGGTILGTSNKSDPFNHKGVDTVPSKDPEKIVGNLERWGIDALFCIGGDGTLFISTELQKIWPRLIGIPKTIDNDLKATDQTFGFDTACNFVTHAIDRIHSTAQSHHRIMVIEVMGRYAGWIALEGGLSGGGDIILVPELPFEFEKVSQVIDERKKRGKRFSIVIVAEGAHPKGGGLIVKKRCEESPDPIRLGGIGQYVSNTLQEMTGLESRATVLGHLQRGGSPSFFDRLLATRYGHHAVKIAAGGTFGKMVSLQGTQMTAVDLSEATSSLKRITPEHNLIKLARSIGTSFGV